MRAHRDDFFGDDRRDECIHGYTKRCPECEAEAEKFIAAERVEAIKVRLEWFLYGACAVLAPTTLGLILWLR